MRRLLAVLAYSHSFRFLRILLLVFRILSAVSTSLCVFFLILAATLVGDNQALIITAFVFFVLTVGSNISIVFNSHFVSVAKSEFETNKEYFIEDTYVFSENIVKRMTNSALLWRRNKAMVASLTIRNYFNIKSTFGQQAIKTINTAIKESISKTLPLNKDYAFGFAPIKGFMVFKKGDDTEAFAKEIEEVTNNVNKILEEISSLPAITILTGVGVGSKPNNYNDLYEKASIAAAYNVATRVISDTVVYNDETMTDEEGEKVLSIELGNAIKEEQLQMYYQPKFHLSRGEFYGAEALIRWNHPSRGLLPPSLFIPFAEQSTRIIDIDMYVFEHVCRDIQKWKREGKRVLTISINLSRKTSLDPNIIRFYKETMEKYEIDPKCIDIELTESMAAQDSFYVSSIIRKIKAMDMEASIDDFGTGYSSFASLKKIPFDTLKIDKSFVDEVELDDKSKNIVKSINDIGHSLGMKTLAEGVETQTQVDIIRELGIDSIQGFYFSKPLSEFEYQRFLSNNSFEKNDNKEEKE